MFAVKGSDEHHQLGTVMMTPKAEAYLVNVLKLDPDRVARESEMFTLQNSEGENSLSTRCAIRLLN